MTETREEVKWFAEQMERVLQRNDYKGGWHNCSDEELFMHLLDEVRELYGNITCIEGNAPIDECVDIANLAMMIADNRRRARNGGARRCLTSGAIFSEC